MRCPGAKISFLQQKSQCRQLNDLQPKELEDVLYNSRYGGCRSPLIVPIPFNKEHENMMRMLQTFVNSSKLRIHPLMGGHYHKSEISQE
jgi:hypothetical protein